MREHSIQLVLLIRAFEEADREGAIVPVTARAAATRRALRVIGLADWNEENHQARNLRNGETISRRARLLYDSLAGKIPALRGVLRVARLGSVAAPMVLGLAFILGLGTNALGTERQINLLSVPLLGTLAWNLSLYLWWILIRVARISPGRHAGRVKAWGRGVVGYVSELFLRGTIRRSLWSWKRRERGDTERLWIISRAILGFGSLWQRCAGDLLAARIQRLLHVGASLFALGMLGGIYVRGIALEYRASWESTWLAAEQVQILMNGILGPASAVMGNPVPDVAPLQAPLHGDAGPWIHLFAVTILLAIVLPRTLLAIWASVRCARLAAALSVDPEDEYFRRIFRDWRGGATSVEIVPYSYRPGLNSLQLLKSWLRDYFGSRADLRLHDPLEYGDGPGGWIGPSADKEPSKAARDVGDGLEDSQVTRCTVIVFNLAQTPEPEVHGTFLEELQERAADRADRLLIVLDAESFERHVRDGNRRAERVRTWQRIAQQAQMEVLVLEPAPEAGCGLHSIARAIWPGETTIIASETPS